jgi:hypothetical protein
MNPHMEADKLSGWFRTEAEHLPTQTRLRALSALEEQNLRQRFLGLEELRKEGELPESWQPHLDEFYSVVF